MQHRIMIKHAREIDRRPSVANPRIPDLRSPNSCLRSAFTLTELLVAIALLMIIMLAVSTVFRSTSETVSAGLATIELNRRASTAQVTLQGDFCGFGPDPFVTGQGTWAIDPTGATSNPPFLFIRNHAQYAFLDKKEWIAEGSPGSAPTDIKHLYRTDSIGFFAQGVFKRQTGGYNYAGNDYWPLISDMWGLNTAYMWYGHLRLPNNNSSSYSYYNPGVSGPSFNPNNYFASQWVLGRVAIALVQPAAHPVNPLAYPHFVADLNQNPVYYYGRAPGGAPTNLAPFCSGRATCGDGNYVNSEQIQESRYDIVGMNAGQTWVDYANILNAFVSTDPNWVENRFSTRFLGNPFAVGDINWTTGSRAANCANFAYNAAQHVPVFLPSCVNFIVEFAGDYVAQLPNGTVPPAAQTQFLVGTPATWHLDGITDFDIVNVNGMNVRRIHWYGYPRRTDGTVGNPRFPVPTNLAGGDVTTVSQMRAQTDSPSLPLMPFEYWPGTDTYNCGWTRDMLCLPASGRTLAPELIRITIQIVDPEGRVRDGMTRQFVFPVKRM